MRFEDNCGPRSVRLLKATLLRKLAALKCPPDVLDLADDWFDDPEEILDMLDWLDEEKSADPETIVFAIESMFDDEGDSVENGDTESPAISRKHFLQACGVLGLSPESTDVAAFFLYTPRMRMRMLSWLVQTGERDDRKVYDKVGDVIGATDG